MTVPMAPPLRQLADRQRAIHCRATAPLRDVWIATQNQ